MKFSSVIKLGVAFAAIIAFSACGDNSSSAEDENIESSKSNANANHKSDGYKITVAAKVEDGILISQTSGCAYHSGNFVWEEYTSDVDTSSFKVEGDTLWIGPNPSDYDPEDHHYNSEVLAISENHNGIYGTWKRTGCERNIATQEIECGPFIGHITGVAQDLIITEDSLTTIYNIDSTALDDQFKSIDIGHFINYLKYDMGNLTEDSLVAAGAIHVDSTIIKLNTQTFSLTDASHFDDTGMNYVNTYTSNGKSCTLRESMGAISKEQCLAGDEEFLLSDRDHSDEMWLYEDGPLGGFNIDNRDEFKNCMYGLLTQETIDFLNANAKYDEN